MRKILFIRDFASKNKGDVLDCDSMLASSLIKRGFAKEIKEEPKKKTRRTKAQIEADKNKD